MQLACHLPLRTHNGVFSQWPLYTTCITSNSNFAIWNTWYCLQKILFEPKVSQGKRRRVVAHFRGIFLEMSGIDFKVKNLKFGKEICIGYWRNINIPRTCPKFYILAKIVLFKNTMRKEIDQQLLPCILWQLKVKNLLFNF